MLKYLNEIKAAFVAVAPDAEVILFGSQARGDAGDDSDVDLLVLLDKPDVPLETKYSMYQNVFEIEMKYQIPINPIITTKKSWYNAPVKTPFYVNVMNEGVRL